MSIINRIRQHLHHPSDLDYISISLDREFTSNWS
jgi:hypothetical protein